MLPPTSPEIYRIVVTPNQANDPRAVGYLENAHALGFTTIRSLACQDIYFIEGSLSQRNLQRLAEELVSDPVTQTPKWGRCLSGAVSDKQGCIVEVTLRPGVTDPVADQIVRAARVCGLDGVLRAATGLRFVVAGDNLDAAALHNLAKRLLVNATIHRYTLGEIEPVFPHPAQASGRVDTISVRGLDDDGLMALSYSRRAALDEAEMKAVQAYFSAERRDPTDIEFEMIAQTWSEHCFHKTFRAQIDVHSEQPFQVNGLLKTYLRSATEKIAAPWVRSAFLDNAGIIDFDDEYEVSFKVETHNHPSAIEPFGGANTGTGGVIRDVLGVSAKPIAATDVLCFGPQNLPPDNLPEGVLHPRRIQSGVVAGVQDYGNKMGIPTVNGAIVYDEGYTANPLVYCGCVGIAPKGSHPRHPEPGDRVIVLGGRTGRDGLRGATFSSMTMDAQTGEVSGASVQIGDPITEKGLVEVITRARDLRLYHAVTDCGAGGLSSAVGEMASECGAEIELTHVELKYPGLTPWEIWLSEAQERMVLAVPVNHMSQLKALSQTFDVAMTDIGVFTTSGRLVVNYAGREVLDLQNSFLHEGIPQRHLQAVITRSSTAESCVETGTAPSANIANFRQTLLALLAHPNIASKAPVIRIYDHEVQGGTVIKPLTGVQDDGPSDGCVLKPQGTRGTTGVVLANGINPEYGKVDAYRMAISVIDEAIRNAVAVGADPQRIALLDNFCWGDPLRPETLGSLVEATRGCHDAALVYGTPFISGKDSLNNEYLGSDKLRHAIPPSLLISSIGIIDDIRQAVTMDLKRAGDVIYLVGEFSPCLGGSHLVKVLEADPNLGEGPGKNKLFVPGLPAMGPAVYQALHRAMQQGLVAACHDLSEGGLAVATAEMCIGGRLGLSLSINKPSPVTALFGETNGCLLVEVKPKDCTAFENLFNDLPQRRLGQVSAAPVLMIEVGGTACLEVEVSDLLNVWNPLGKG